MSGAPGEAKGSGPIVWWSPSLAFHVPGWLKGPRGPGVSPAMSWYPLVTFWQVTAALGRQPDD